MKSALIALVGDHDLGVIAHRAIGHCFDLASAVPLPVQGVWLPTEKVIPREKSSFNGFAGIWVVPASPYRNTDGVLWAIEYARTRKVPFLGTCGGFQHALLEYARNICDFKSAGHAENEPGTEFPLLTRMTCSLVEKTQVVRFLPGTILSKIYGSDNAIEQFHCNYGLNPVYEQRLSNKLCLSARSEDEQLRAIELPDHPFFMGTLFQPERRALAGELHPIVRAFLKACVQGRGRGLRAID